MHRDVTLGADGEFHEVESEIYTIGVRVNGVAQPVPRAFSYPRIAAASATQWLVTGTTWGAEADQISIITPSGCRDLGPGYGIYASIVELVGDTFVVFGNFDVGGRPGGKKFVFDLNGNELSRADYPLTPVADGFLDCQGGVPVLNEDRRLVRAFGMNFSHPLSRGRWLVGQSDDNPVLAWDGQTLYKTSPAPTQWAPRLAVKPTGEVRLAISYDPDVPILSAANFIAVGGGPVTVPSFAPFPRPILVAPFQGTNPGTGPAVDGIGVFTEADPASAVAANPAKAVIWLHDGPEAPSIPSSLRPTIDYVWVECYRVQGESEIVAFQRWRSNVAAVCAGWSGKVGIVPMFYGQGGAPPNELWSIQEIVNAAYTASDMARDFPAVTVIAPFALNRANGIVAHPELQALYANLQAAARGVSPPPPPPPPSPTPTFDLGALILMAEAITLTPGYYADQVKTHPDPALAAAGCFAIQQPNGAYVTWLHDGTVSEQPNGAFDQEAIKLAKIQPSAAFTLYLADRTSYPEGRVYPVIVYPR